MLELIDLDIPELGYKRFISAWLYKAGEGSFLVDAGPARTVDALCGELSKKGVERLDWILLTHIHMDHAGSVGHLAERFPEARVFCHEKAAAHLADPARLWQGTKQTLGEVAETYGEIRPVAPGRIVTGERVDFGEGIRAIDTPGHAPHHLCFAFSDMLFGGELFGVYHAIDSDFYMRPATPPRFLAEAFFASLDRVAPEADGRSIFFAHHGSHPDGREILEQSKAQLSLWMDVIGRHLEEPELEAVIDDLLENDSRFSRLNQLPSWMMARERFYIKNSINGILSYLKEKRS
jgi:glyoxylase-like metal-dependent hydrolase (beta-lactamase superfamily II)